MTPPPSARVHAKDYGTSVRFPPVPTPLVPDSPRSDVVPPSDPPLVLVSNDDGYFAAGLAALATALRRYARVIVCAPETEQSTTSHSLTLTRPLRLRRVAEDVFAVDGTPADCVYIALMAEGRVLPRRPDLVVSGLNHGMNLGSDVFYSGTVAAAREAALRNVPAVATSADLAADRDAAAAVCARIAISVLRRSAGRPTAPLINVNVPPGAQWPVVASRLGSRLYDDLVEFRIDPRGREYLWIGGGGVRHRPVPGSDTEAYDRGAVSVTALLLDLTAGPDAALCGEVAADAAAGG